MSEPIVITLVAHGVAEVQGALRTIEQSILNQERSAGRAVTRHADDRIKVARKEADERSRILAGTAAAGATAYRTDERASAEAERRKTREAEKWARARERIQTNSALMAGRLAEREADAEIAAMKRVQAARERFARGIAGRVTGTLSGLASSATALVGGTMAVGAGFAVADAARSALSAEKQAVLLSNSAYNPLDPNTRRRDPRELIGKAGAVGVAANYGKTDVLRGLTEYIRLSSDATMLDANNGTATELAKLAKSTGTDIVDLFKMAGNARVQNTNLDQAGMMTLMRSVVGQGKAGAVELEDLVKYGGEIMSTAGSYAGDQTTNQSKLIGLAQFGRRVADVAESSTAVRHLATDVSRRADEYEALGVKVKARDASGKVTRGLADSADVIANLMEYTGGDVGKLSKLHIGERSMKLFNAASLVFNPAYDAARGTEAEKRKAGAAAVRKEISSLENASYSQADIDADFAAIMKSTSERFEKAVLEIKAVLEEKLTPWIERFAQKLPELVPKIERLIDSTGKLAEWFANNPFKGIGAIVLAAIAKDLAGAAIGSAVKAAITRALSGAAVGGGGGAGAPVAGAAGGVGAKAGVLGVAAGLVAGDAVLRYAEGTDAAEDLAAKVNAWKRGDRERGVSPQAAAKLQKDAAERLDKGSVLGHAADLATSVFSEGSEKSYARYKSDQALVDNENLKRAIADAIKAGADMAKDEMRANGGAPQGGGNPARSNPQTHPSRGGAQ